MDPVTMAIVGGSSLAAGMASSAMNSGIQYGTSKSLAKYNYKLGQRSLRESPSNYKQGLISAGINPILASNSPIGATQGSSGVNPNFDPVGDVSKGVSAKMLYDQTKSQVDLNKSASEKNGSESIATLENAKSNRIQAQAALKNAETSEKMLTVSGVNAGSNAVGTLGDLVKDGALTYTAIKNGKVSTGGTSAKSKGKNSTIFVPSPNSADSVSKNSKFLSGLGSALISAGYPAAAALGTAGAAYGAGKLMEKKGYGKIVDQGPNKNELRHRTGGLGNSSTKTKTSTRRHN